MVSWSQGCIESAKKQRRIWPATRRKSPAQRRKCPDGFLALAKCAMLGVSLQSRCFSSETLLEGEAVMAKQGFENWEDADIEAELKKLQVGLACMSHHGCRGRCHQQCRWPLHSEPLSSQRLPSELCPRTMAALSCRVRALEGMPRNCMLLCNRAFPACTKRLLCVYAWAEAEQEARPETVASSPPLTETLREDTPQPPPETPTQHTSPLVPRQIPFTPNDTPEDGSKSAPAAMVNKAVVALSNQNLRKRVARLMTPTAAGKTKIPQEVIDEWNKSDAAGQERLCSEFKAAGFDKARVQNCF